eukprot:CAMPEP_0178984110 /NCGR_PEP_ID=MMETSP0795-20121207/1423_1 /TAXON_ID=88552 /ORGANISM="Amoebophrya sp., Strain Ameob2" /LENGTH=112 /DNA_ID=CAMNT_0020674937 /DNA_START=348 /DNA_END=687 /DNA_ORIENTATION=-
MMSRQWSDDQRKVTAGDGNGIAGSLADSQKARPAPDALGVARGANSLHLGGDIEIGPIRSNVMRNRASTVADLARQQFPPQSRGSKCSSELSMQLVVSRCHEVPRTSLRVEG